MAEQTKKRIPAPAWVDKDPSEWPPGIRLAFSILARSAERELAAEQDGHRADRESA